MGIDYKIYAEVKAGHRWYNISPLIKNVKGETVLCPLRSGRSSLHFFVQDLRDGYITGGGVPEDASEEIMGLFHQPLDDTTKDFFSKNITYRQYYQSQVFTVGYVPAIKNRVVKDRPYKYRGYVIKSEIAAFEVEETDTISMWLSPSEYRKLSAADKLEYAWYEWNEPNTNYEILTDLNTKVEVLLLWFLENGFPYDSGVSRSEISYSDVRLIVTMS